MSKGKGKSLPDGVAMVAEAGERSRKRRHSCFWQKTQYPTVLGGPPSGQSLTGACLSLPGVGVQVAGLGTVERQGCSEATISEYVSRSCGSHTGANAWTRWAWSVSLTSKLNL